MTETTVDRDSVSQFSYELYKKKSETLISALVKGPITVHTREGHYSLSADWQGRIAIDSDGYPYPIAEAEFQKIYEEA